MTSYLNSRLMERISGASARQLDYWVRQGLISPSGAPSTSRKWRKYTLSDAFNARIIVSLREQGVSLQAIRQVARVLQLRQRQALDPAGALRHAKLIVDGGNVFVTDEPGPVYRAIDGQTTFLFMNLGHVKEEVERRLAAERS